MRQRVAISPLFISKNKLCENNFFRYYLIVFVFAIVGATLLESEGGAGIHFPHTLFSSHPARADGFGKYREIASAISFKMGSR
ncbi:hypothetical protein COV42_01095 [Candidatus Campbellbacteria bacterium CG11_big_fil_rev_8_21_14_0_20_44_21]|uniref:Uncharacterized protein n=1 Tax=Candidatus Campbellbacteria bacterium CG22_combo_CG10-13_8_21_14_all_43_18 TaxID=1974530 RepID=A0A2H0DW57_9BACT|nr:MAG: hypothetical protein COW82_02190 [Candidatus Campbellbacteria bacterium CG22_combo_CG10-13_8_21_14_all_43_18]PIR24365.1 MAG: hypothetical protein COV42_01095 [Candidatus Campbellbacteria bacterium CG11_big_fil_rev_8_21_14_0_20_44_21]